MSLPTWAEKTVHGVEIHQLSSKEKVLGTAISKKKDHADSLLELKKTHHY